MTSPDMFTQAGQQTFPAATLHEAAGRTGALPARLRPAYAGAALQGPAFPIFCPEGDNLWLHRAIYAASPGDILVVQIAGAEEFGYWGEILSEAAVARGLGGLVIDGGVRDTSELERVGLPVFSAQICMRGTVKDPNGPGVLGRPIEIGSVQVSRGDWVVGDGDGVVVIPQDRVAAVFQASQDREAKEALVIQALRGGATTLEIYNLSDG